MSDRRACPHAGLGDRRQYALHARERRRIVCNQQAVDGNLHEASKKKQSSK